MALRRPDFAGSWYPESEGECQATLAEFERQSVCRKGSGTLCGGIVPHAGWIFSGRLAYNVIRELARAATDQPQTVVLFGGHLGPSSPITVMDHGEFWTPLGPIPTDEELAEAIAARSDARRESPERHRPDNTVELQAPFIRHHLPQARIVVVGAPPRPEMLDLAATLPELAHELGRRLLVIGSTDLTHYGPNYGWSPKGQGPAAEKWVREENDPRFIERACRLDAGAVVEDALERSNACCPGAAAAAVQCAQRLGSGGGELLAYATSADVRRDVSFVGYAGILL